MVVQRKSPAPAGKPEAARAGGSSMRAPEPGPYYSLLARGPRALLQLAGPGDGLPRPDLHEAARAGLAGGATALPFASSIARSLGRAHDLSSVVAHVGGAAGEACDRIGASAYASGAHVAFRSPPDLHTAAHETAHVLQQRA